MKTLLVALLLALPLQAQPLLIKDMRGQTVYKVVSAPPYMAMAAFASPEPPLADAGIIVPGRKAPSPPPLANTLTVPAGRFVPLIPADGSPSYLPPNPAYRVYAVKPGSFYTGVIYNAPDGAEQEVYSWPDVKTPVYVLQSRNISGSWSVQFIKNGPADVGPIVNGSPLTVEIVVGPRPPPPQPPPPVPPEPPAPIPGQGLRVMFVYDKSVVLPATQQAILDSSAIHTYLRTHAAKGPDGTTPEVRYASSTADMSKESAVWQTVFARPRTSLPWILIGGGPSNDPGFEGPLPATVDATLTLLKRFGGQ